MDHGGRSSPLLAGALWVATFVATLLLTGFFMRDAPEATATGVVHATADTAVPTGSLTSSNGPASQDQLLADDELDDRSWAIRELAASPSPESVEALALVATTSADHRERLEAVDALGRIAASGESGELARSALRQAASDRNASVSTRARGALRGR